MTEDVATKYEKEKACEKKIFEDFFVERFKRPVEKGKEGSVIGYSAEWEDRFHKGEPERWMDSESLNSYIKVLREAAKEGCVK